MASPSASCGHTVTPLCASPAWATFSSRQVLLASGQACRKKGTHAGREHKQAVLGVCMNGGSEMHGPAQAGPVGRACSAQCTAGTLTVYSTRNLIPDVCLHERRTWTRTSTTGRSTTHLNSLAASCHARWSLMPLLASPGAMALYTLRVRRLQPWPLKRFVVLEDVGACLFF